MLRNCYCCSSVSFSECCQPLIEGKRPAPTAEKLMRSRYSAYATQSVDYLIATTHSSKKKYLSKSDILNWARANQWVKLEIVKASDNIVEFKAYYLDSDLKAQIHHERSYFEKENNLWFYIDGDFY